MTAARTLPDVGPYPAADAAANDGPLASWTGAAGFWTAALGETPPCNHDATLAGPIGLAIVGSLDGGAQTRAPLVATQPDGAVYRGDLWLDILAYRSLRMRDLGGTRLDPEQATRLAALERRLGIKEAGGARQFVRFGCRRTAGLTTPDGERRDVVLVDVSAGGAKLEVAMDASGIEGAPVTLHVEDAGGPIDTSLPSRVIWTRPGVLGIMFAGAARQGR